VSGRLGRNFIPRLWDFSGGQAPDVVTYVPEQAAPLRPGHWREIGEVCGMQVAGDGSFQRGNHQIVSSEPWSARRFGRAHVSILRLSAFWSSVSVHPASIPKHPCSHQPRSLILRLLHDLDDYVERGLGVLAREALKPKPRRMRARLDRSSQFENVILAAHARRRLLACSRYRHGRVHCR